jgi:hypothetical protein
LETIPSAAEVCLLEMRGFWLACVVSILLGITRKQIAICLAAIASAVFLFFAGTFPVPEAVCWQGLKEAFSISVHSTYSSSFPSIVRDLAIVGYIVIRRMNAGGILEVKKYLQSGKDAGQAIAAAFVLAVVYHLAITIPKDLAAPAFHLYPSVRAELKPAPSIPPTRLIAKQCVISVDAGAGGDSYKRLCDLDFAQMAIDETNKIEDLIDDIERNRGDDSPGTTEWRFHLKYDDCCKQYLPEMRTEVLARLGPVVQEDEEKLEWRMIVPDPIPNVPLELQMSQHRVTRFDVQRYIPYLRKLGVHLKHTMVPRREPIVLQHAEQILPTQVLRFPFHELITAYPNHPISAGYVLIEFSDPPAQVRAAFQRSHYAFASQEVTDNSDLRGSLLAGGAATRIIGLRIGSVPLSKKNPLLVDVNNSKQLRVTIRWFDE